LKIGIIVDSKSGFTHSIAQRLEEKLSVLRHDVQIERIEPIDEKQIPEKQDTGLIDADVFLEFIQGATLKNPTEELVLIKE
jgi:flavodoxin